MFLPRRRGLPELVTQHRPLGVLRLPALQPRPGGEQRLVDDLDAAARSLLAVPASALLVLDQEARVDQAAQDPLRFIPPLSED